MAGGRVWFRACTAALALAALGAFASPAAGEHVTLGVADPVETRTAADCAPPCTSIQTALSTGNVAAPGNGRLTSWWALSFGLPTSAELRVVRRDPDRSGRKFTAVATSSQQTIGTTMTRFPTDLPIATGNLIGVT